MNLKAWQGNSYNPGKVGCRRLFTPRGFTLIETIIFIVLVGFFLWAFVAPFSTSVQRMEKPEIVAGAMFLAKEKLEQLQPTTYSAVQDETRAPLGGDYAAFERQVTVTLVDSNLSSSATDQGYKKVTVTVFHPQLPAAGLVVETLYTDFAD
jgi:type II secretory pathway pseudopilin PulG